MAQGPAILIVEDETRMRELLHRAITSWGMTAAVARSGEEAARIMEASPHGIVLLDLNLPAMSGMELFEVIRGKWPGTQVIILTGFGDLEAARKAIHLDVVEFLTKPCHLGELEQAIDRARRRIEENRPLPERPAEALAEESAQQTDAPATLEELERQHILAALARHDGNRTAAAAELGISLRTLYYRLSEYQRQGGDL